MPKGNSLAAYPTMEQNTKHVEGQRPTKGKKGAKIADFRGDPGEPGRNRPTVSRSKLFKVLQQGTPISAQRGRFVR